MTTHGPASTAPSSPPPAAPSSPPAPPAAAPSTRRLIPTSGWSSSFANLLAKEYSVWWRTRRWQVHLLLWLVAIDGLIALGAYGDAREPGATTAHVLHEGAELLFKAGGFLTALGAVLATQGTLIGERQQGTAAWILSKPASRAAFILAKFVAHATSLLLLAVAIPALAFHGQFLLIWGRAPSPLPFLAGLLMLSLHLLFYLALSLLLGTVFNHRGAVAGTSLSVLFAGFVLSDHLPRLAMLLPWRLADGAMSLVLGDAAPPGWPAPPFATAVWILLFLAGALARFRREEL